MPSPRTSTGQFRSRRSIIREESAGIMSSLEFDPEAFMRSLAAHIASLEIKSEAALWTLGLKVQNDARLLCPVDTGRLRSSIQATKEGPNVVAIGTNVGYAAFVEFGTRYMAAQPYLRPALAHATGFLVREIAG